jgi:hypothetical protein
MRTVIILLVLIFILPTISKCQPRKFGFHYKIKRYDSDSHEIPIYYRTSRTTFETKTLCVEKLKANIVQVGDTLKIDFWGITRETSGCFVDNFVNSRQSLENGRFFYRLVHKRQNNADVQRYLSVPTSSWEVGLTTVPFKYRFGNTTATDTIPNDASTAVNSGGYVGRQRSRRYEINQSEVAVSTPVKK